MDRLLRTKDMRSFMGEGQPASDNNIALRGGRSPNDPVFSGFDLQKLVHDRARIEDLWSPFYALDQIL
jgi:hypothetical protein